MVRYQNPHGIFVSMLFIFLSRSPSELGKILATLFHQYFFQNPTAMQTNKKGAFRVGRLL
jgi:hypothetical protein